MKPTDADDILDLLDAAFPAAALGAALELGLFWLLETRPLHADEVARELGIPSVRCRYWLQMLSGAGLLEQNADGFSPSSAARSAILGTYSWDTWALLASEASERLPGLCDLPRSLREPDSAWEVMGLTRRMYVEQMREDAERARRFTRMLYELHRPLADELANCLDLSGVDRLMDLGGGSGVVSLAFLRRHLRLRATVVDVPNVCVAGREIAAENSLGDRLSYHAADFLRDELPSDFDMVLECDVNVYTVPLFGRGRCACSPCALGARRVVEDPVLPVPDSGYDPSRPAGGGLSGSHGACSPLSPRLLLKDDGWDGRDRSPHLTRRVFAV
jgi:hypothetical protein